MDKYVHSPVPVSDAAARFFDNYLKCLAKASIPDKQRRWYVKRVEEFINAHNEHKIKGLLPADIAAYFDVIGRKKRLVGWQFYQCIDAIRILYCDLLKPDICGKVDWQYWLDSARQLDADHPTTARQLSPDELTYFKERYSTGPLNELRGL